MGVLSDLKPKKVFHYFEEICSIPHGSGNIEQISDYLVKFAKERSLRFRQDEKGNVIIWKDGSKGYEQSAPVILQGHMDMVAVKEEGCNKNLDTEGLDLEINGDMISATGTSLGGDDGIAVAFSLALLDDDELAHPPLEAVFTVDEEIGMLGADYMDMSDLKGRILLNMDSEEEGVFTVSCAGGATVTSMFSFRRENVTAEALRVKIENFTGGHSGVEIDKGRANANVAMGRILRAAGKAADIRLETLNGGEKDNAIAKFGEAVIVTEPEKQEAVQAAVKKAFGQISEEYRVTDPDAVLVMEVLPMEERQVFTRENTEAVVTAMLCLPAGIQRKNPQMPELVQTSLNLGVVITDKEKISLSFSVRSSVESEKEYLIDQITCLTEALGGSVTVTGQYPGWEYRSDSPLRELLIEVYKEMYQKEPVVEGIHAGLECGIFASRLDNLDAVSIGPQMYHIHTTKEELSISSAQRTWELVLRTLERLK